MTEYEKVKAWRKKNPTKRSIQGKRHYAKHKERILKRMKDNYPLIKEGKQAQARRYYFNKHYGMTPEEYEVYITDLDGEE